MMRILSLVTLAFASVAATSQAASLQVNGIPSFNTSLGTLNSVSVLIDPPTMNTSIHSVSPFDSISNHSHNVNLNPVTIPNLATFLFPSTQTTFASVSFGEEDHFHTVNVPAAQLLFTGSSLNWFLNPSNNVPSVSIPGTVTTPSQSHTHTLPTISAVPRTTFNYTPVPEPHTGALLACVAALVNGGRRRR